LFVGHVTAIIYRAVEELSLKSHTATCCLNLHECWQIFSWE